MVKVVFPTTAVSEDEFKARFKGIFDLHPTLSPEKFHAILTSNNLDEQKSIAELSNKAKHTNKLLNAPSIPSTPLHPQRHCKSTDYLDSSDDEPIGSYSQTLKASSQKVSKSTTLYDHNVSLPSLEAKLELDLTPYLPPFTPPRKNLMKWANGEEFLDDSEEDPITSTLPQAPRKKTSWIEEVIESHKSSSFTKKISREISKKRKYETELEEAILSDNGESLQTTYYKRNTYKSRKPRGTSKAFAKLSKYSKSDREILSIVSSDTENEDESSSPASRKVSKATDESPKVTPWIGKLAGDLFARSLTTIGENVDVSSENKNIKNTPTTNLKDAQNTSQCRYHARGSIRFNPDDKIWFDDKQRTTGYRLVAIGELILRPGDCISVRSSGREKLRKKKRAANTSDDSDVEKEDAPFEPWFARIMYIYETEFGEGMAHLRWFQRGSETILGELAGSHEIFLLTQCDDNLLECIEEKIEVSYIGSDLISSSTSIGVVEEVFSKPSHYFYRQHYDPATQRFTDASKHQKHPDLFELPADHPRCYVCASLAATARDQDFHTVNSSSSIIGVRLKGIEYRRLDFVYILPERAEHGLYRIGQISKITVLGSTLYSNRARKNVRQENIRLHIDLYGRYDGLLTEDWFTEIESGRDHAVRDERRLYKSSLSIAVKATDLEGKCHVQHRRNIDDFAKFKDQEDTFWVKDRVSHLADRNNPIRIRHLEGLKVEHFQSSDGGQAEYESNLSNMQDFLDNGQKLRCMDIFSGAGGLSCGLHKSGAVETHWAIEKDPRAAATFRLNNPAATIYESDVSTILERRIRLSKGEKLEPLKDSKGNIIPDPPRKGEVELVIAGFPCPGFSRANRYPKSDDIKNKMVALSSEQNGKHATKGGIEKGTVKFIVRSLQSLGYQVQYTVLQAAEYGTPQARRRAFFWASLSDCPLPDFPQPTNVFFGQMSNSWHRNRRAAPHDSITIGAAIADLPKFEWKNPHNVCRQTQTEKAEQEKRQHTITQYAVTEKCKFVGRNHQSYDSEPLSEYQRQMRVGVPSNGLFNHVTKFFSEKTDNSERVCQIPLRPDADHRYLPEALKPWALSHPDSAAARNGGYVGSFGRLDMQAISKTCMTTVNPSGNSHGFLHPTQHRIVSAREFARIQGFPDSFKFDLESPGSLVTGVIKMIGNAVPIPLGYALGRELRKVLVAKYLAEKDEEVPRKTASAAGKSGASKDNAINLDSDSEVEEIKEEEV